MKKKILALVLISLFAGNAFCDDFTISDAEPYDTKSTPQWLKDMRRAEIITLGSWPFTLLLTSIGHSLIQVAKHGGDPSYMRNPFSTAGGNYNQSETIGIIFTSLGISVGVGLADFIASTAKRKKIERESGREEIQSITITPLEERMGALFLQEQNEEIFFGNLESAVF